MQPKATALKKVDASQKDVLQTGFVDGEAVKKESPPPADPLSQMEQGEKLAYQRILKQLVPTFPLNKLEKQTLEGLRRFFEAEVSPIIQETIQDRFKNISP